MQGPQDSQAWGAIGAGLRPSTVLCVGALLTAAAPILQTWPEAHTAAWIVWGASLAACAAGLIMSGLRAWCGPVGVVAGLLFLAQLVAMAAALSGLNDAALAYRMLAVPKMLVLVLIAMVSRKQLSPRRRSILVIAGLVGAAKIAARVNEAIPPAWEDAVDAGVNTLVAVALGVMARGLRKRENEWAHQTHELHSSSFEDFNRR